MKKGRIMRRRLTLRFVVVVFVFAVFYLGVVGACVAATKATRDWTKHPAVVEVDTKEDVFAVGDAHADPGRLVGVLVAAKIIDGVPKKPGDISWAAGKSVLVITGDMIDKGTNSL
jgi:hypothetical protein